MKPEMAKNKDNISYNRVRRSLVCYLPKSIRRQLSHCMAVQLAGPTLHLSSKATLTSATLTSEVSLGYN